MIATLRDAVPSSGFKGVWPFVSTPRIQTHSRSSTSAYRRRRKKSIVIIFCRCEMKLDMLRNRTKDAEGKVRVSYARNNEEDKTGFKRCRRIKYR